MPIDHEDGNICYCTYTATPSKSADNILNTINTSQTSNDVLKTCIKLHRADNLKDAMEGVISEIRSICSAETCTVLLMNEEKEEYSILATNFKENSTIKSVTTFSGFYDIAHSWIDMLGDEGDCIIIGNREDMEHNLRGFEALARMKDTDGSMIYPGEFVPIAENVGLIDKIDSMVFRKAADFFSGLLKKTGLELTLSLNVSVRHLMKNGFLDEIQELLETSGIPADKLEIEITESIMIDSVDKALQCIHEIKKMGIKIAIDDFGTGYSSLSYLNNFPANLLKIDKSFIDKMNSGASSRQYVAAIISIGHIMGFDVISEGVEEADQLDTLKETGCDFIQGFIWGRPMSAEDAENLVSSITGTQ